MAANSHIRAIIWDYDGTLVDTGQKNLNVTKKLIRDIAHKNPDDITALQSLENYDEAIKKTSNWRELYTKEFGLSEEQTDSAGRLWTEYQLNDTTPTAYYDGIDSVLESLKTFPQGIVSANAHLNIEHALQVCDLLRYFSCIVGYEQVAYERQKPEPDGVLMCLEKIAKLDTGVIFYIGDHEADARCVFNSNKAFKRQNRDIRVISIGAFYGSEHDDSDWKVKPDYKAADTQDIISIIQSFSSR
ncbi:HAD family hydrolase [candidate division KSB1 bacterium]|nr:HAD family hydrolase [candidate division KSB1 bacterium]NIR69678.1 HAD family hydrolase [candidate division KSB1 bacterium]NIS24328.1 HAD family hydrolase [candidate division KSB1 bacterium]NIT71256.1 HAD family hydrolase [candidate division KSB1 bacterium]NIU24962.1 HAD family hydrolase [candidate division KSB1 bacterium]